MKSFASQLWAGVEPQEGYIIYGVRYVGEEWYTLFTDIREALKASRYAHSVHIFWKLD